MKPKPNRANPKAAEPPRDLSALTLASIRTHLQVALTLAATQGLDVEAILREEKEKDSS